MRKNFSLILAAILGISSCQAISGTGREDPDIPSIPGEDRPETETFFYKEVTGPMEDWSGECLIAYSGNGSVKALDSWGDADYGSSSSDLSGHVTSSGIPAETGDMHKSTITKEGSHYTINVSGIGFIGYRGSKNALYRSMTQPSAGDTDYLWDISFTEGHIVLECVSAPGRRLQWNSSHPRFACYTGSQQELTVYIKTAGDITPGPDPKPDPDPEPEPDPDVPSPPAGGYGWYELPVMETTESGGYMKDSGDPGLWYAYHLCAGNEKGPEGRKARNYTVCYSATHHCPLWVAAPRHTMYEGSAKRTEAYAKDPGIPADIQYNSKSIGGGCNKGHMLGSAERTSSAATNRQVFYYSNIAPQEMNNFNTGGGGWNNLEDWVDRQVCQDTLYVVIGTHFGEYTDRRGYSCLPKTISFGGRDDVTMPTMFYYVLLRTKDGNSGKALGECTASELKCAAFVRSHSTPRGVKVDGKDMMSVKELEGITGLSFFANVPQAPKAVADASDWGL